MNSFFGSAATEPANASKDFSNAATATGLGASLEETLALTPSNAPAVGNALQSAVKPRVLIVPNAASWIIGQMAMHVIRRFSDRYEFWLLTDKMIRLRPDLVRALLPLIDFIFPLTDKGYHLARKAVQPMTLPPCLLWVHHVTTWNPAMQEAVRRSSELIACTETWREEVELQSPAGVPVTVVPHGVDANALRRVKSQRSKFGMPSDSFVVGFVGSKTSNYDEGRKGLDTLHTIIQAARTRIPNLHISFLGLGWEEEVQALLRQGVSANYVGFIPESQLAAFYSSIDVYLLTSRVEGGPCTVLEAMACETAVVATRVGLVPEVIVDGETGFSAQVGDSETLLSHLCELSSSPSLRKQIGVAARARVAASRSWDATLRNLEEPLSRMQARSIRKLASASVASSRRAADLIGAVHAVDGLLWGLVSWWQGLVAAPAAIRLVQSCWEGYGARDVLRGLGLITRLAFRPAAIRKLLEKSASTPAQTFSFPERNTESCETTLP
jgi:glycosyltransferase involved in cell wall biosynthesis